MADADQRGVTGPLHVGYLGPAGTFTEDAARLYAPDARLSSYATISAVGSAVRSGDVDEGMVPIENSLQGSVTDTLDGLIREDGLFIRRELVLPIVHCLVAKPHTLMAKVSVIYSHPQALGQCRRFLERSLPQAEVGAALSTAAAVEQMRESTVVAAAIATRRAAELYGAEVLAEGIQDNPNNVTRFVVLSRLDHLPTGRDKTSLCFSFAEDRPGQLHRVMQEFARRDINLSKVESRPTGMGLGLYYFLVDLEGHRLDQPIKEALERVGEMTSLMKVLGSYPRYTIAGADAEK